MFNELVVEIDADADPNVVELVVVAAVAVVVAVGGDVAVMPVGVVVAAATKSPAAGTEDNGCVDFFPDLHSLHTYTPRVSFD